MTMEELYKDNDDKITFIFFYYNNEYNTKEIFHLYYYEEIKGIKTKSHI